MSREVHVRFCESLGVRFPGATHPIVGFQYQTDADRFLEQSWKRLAQFGLELHPDKTRRIEFGRFAEENRKRREEKGSRTRLTFWALHISVERTDWGFSR
jgi:hypothetical protein